MENFFKDIYNIENKTGKRVFADIVNIRTPAIKEQFLKQNKAPANMAELFDSDEAKKVFNNRNIKTFYITKNLE